MPGARRIPRLLIPAAACLCLFSACDDDGTTPLPPVASRCLDYNDYMHWVRAIPIGPVTDFALAGNYAFVIGGGTFRTVDMSRYNEEVKATLPIASYASAITLAGDLAFVCENRQVSIIDILSPLGPTLRSRPTLGIGTSDVAVLGHYAYVTSLESALTVIDILDPATPRVGVHLAESNGLDIEIADSVAYVSGGGGFLTVDLSQPDAPRTMGSLNLARSVFGVSLVGSYAYLSAGSQMYVIDVSDPAAPHMVATLSDFYGTAGVVSGVTLYSLNGFGAIDVIDVSNPVAPALLGSITPPPQPDVAGAEHGIALNAPYLYATFGGSLQEVDIMFPRWPHPVGHADVTGTQLAVSGSLAYVMDYHTVSVVDVSMPDTPQKRGSVQIDAACTAIAADGYTAYVGSAQRLDIISAKSVTTPRIMAGLEMPTEVFSIAVSKPYLYTAGEARLHVISVLDSLAPVDLGSAALSAPGSDVVTSGSFAFVATREGLDVVDVSSPPAPALITTNHELRYAESLAWIGSQLVVSTYDYAQGGVLYIVDASNPWNPVVVDQAPGAGRMVAEGEYIYHMSFGSLYITHVRSGRPSVMVGNFPVDASDVAVDGSWVYTAGEELLVYPLQCESR